MVSHGEFLNFEEAIKQFMLPIITFHYQKRGFSTLKSKLSVPLSVIVRNR